MSYHKTATTFLFCKPTFPISLKTKRLSVCKPPPSFPVAIKPHSHKYIPSIRTVCAASSSMSKPQSPCRRWVIHSLGDINNLQLENFSLEPPNASQVQIQVHAIGLNFADVFATLGLYEAAGEPPICPGFEVSGVVAAVGEDVQGISVDDRVFAIVRFGAYTSDINVDSTFVRPIPDKWSFRESVAFGAQAFTAWYALCVLGGIPSNGDAPLHVTSARKVVLVHSAAGGVGLQLVEMINKVGAELVAVVGSIEKVKTLQERGVDRERIIVRGVDDKKGFDVKVREILGGDGVDVVVDSLLGAYFEKGYSLLNVGGRHVVMGFATIMPSGPLGLLRGGLKNVANVAWKFVTRPKLDVATMINQNKTVSGFNLSYLFDRTDLLSKGFREIEAMELRTPLIGTIYPFEEAPHALKFFQSGKSVGKIVLQVQEDE